MSENKFSPEAQEQKEKPHLKLWLIDDDEAMARAIQRLLKFEVSGIEIQYFPDGESALAHLEEELPDAVAIDYDLGENKIKGDEIAKSIAQKNNEIFIIAISSLQEPNELIQQSAQQAGAQAFIVNKSNISRQLPLILKKIREDVGKL